MIKVYYPHGGKHFLLHWYCYDERGNIFLARREENIKPAVISISEKYPDAEIRGYYEIEIVAPSKFLCTMAELAVLKEERDIFYYEVLSRLRHVIKAGKALPPPFEVCSNYETDEEDEVRNEWDIESHYFCKNCKDTIKLTGTSKEELFEKYGKAWRELYPWQKYIDPRKVPSQAEIAKDDEKELYFVDASSFGQAGLTLDKIDIPEQYPPAHWIDQALFFYRKVREIETTELQTILDQRKKLLEQQQKRKDKESDEKRKKYEAEQIEKTISFFS
jgi:hypothetical protein